MEQLSHHLQEDCVLSPLHDSLSEKEVNSNELIVCRPETRPIGMSNFKSKPKTPTKNYRKLWQTAARKIKLLDDPWHEFHIDSYPVENVVRHRYNPSRKEWRKDDCVVKMEKYEKIEN